MLKIFARNHQQPEIKYIIDILISEYLGLEYQLIENEQNEHYIIVLPNDKHLTIQNHFFSKFKELDYLDIKNIPQKILYAKNRFTPENDIPVLYGTSSVLESDNSINCGLDIFASSFFMLTRWEEIVIKNRDKFNRFPDDKSLAHKADFYYRPIVNEFLEMLWNMLKYLGYDDERKACEYTVKLTHDVDHFRRYDSFRKVISALGGDIWLRKNPLLMFSTISDSLLSNLKLKLDNYDTFDFLMNVSEENNITSHFYFIPGIKGDYDFRYDITSKKIIETIYHIKNRGHVIGIHPSFETFNNAEKFNLELNRFKKIAGEIREGRQHYLRFENPTTWRLWNKNNLETDSSLGFHDDVGFRAGTCFSYPVFDVLSRKKLALKESPLIAMDIALKTNSSGFKEFNEKLITISNTVRKYNGRLELLWHNGNLYTYNWSKYKDRYNDIIKSLIIK